MASGIKAGGLSLPELFKQKKPKLIDLENACNKIEESIEASSEEDPQSYLSLQSFQADLNTIKSELDSVKYKNNETVAPLKKKVEALLNTVTEVIESFQQEVVASFTAIAPWQLNITSKSGKKFRTQFCKAITPILKGTIPDSDTLESLQRACEKMKDTDKTTVIEMINKEYPNNKVDFETLEAKITDSLQFQREVTAIVEIFPGAIEANIPILLDQVHQSIVEGLKRLEKLNEQGIGDLFLKGGLQGLKKEIEAKRAAKSPGDSGGGIDQETQDLLRNQRQLRFKAPTSTKKFFGSWNEGPYFRELIGTTIGLFLPPRKGDDVTDYPYTVPRMSSAELKLVKDRIHKISVDHAAGLRRLGMKHKHMLTSAELKKIEKTEKKTFTRIKRGKYYRNEKYYTSEQRQTAIKKARSEPMQKRKQTLAHQKKQKKQFEIIERKIETIVAFTEGVEQLRLAAQVYLSKDTTEKHHLDKLETTCHILRDLEQSLKTGNDETPYPKVEKKLEEIDVFFRGRQEREANLERAGIATKPKTWKQLGKAEKSLKALRKLVKKNDAYSLPIGQAREKLKEAKTALYAADRLGEGITEILGLVDQAESAIDRVEIADTRFGIDVFTQKALTAIESELDDRLAEFKDSDDYDYDYEYESESGESYSYDYE